ncbi:uncharacterized protein [Cherax quadricarinatus]|uniref:uncharacterized protein n=1 Tax=Cherax quadricarinatus TaxID=27406 RepID=UPI00387E939A
MALSVRRRVNTIGIELLRGAISPSSVQVLLPTIIRETYGIQDDEVYGVALNGAYRIFVKLNSTSVYESLVTRFQDVSLDATPAVKVRLIDVSRHFTWVKIRNVPFEADEADIRSVFETYGTVHLAQKGKWTAGAYMGRPEGTFSLKMTLRHPIPSYVVLEDFRTQVMVSYAGQRRTCRICGAYDHMAAECVKLRRAPAQTGEAPVTSVIAVESPVRKPGPGRLWSEEVEDSKEENGMCEVSCDVKGSVTTHRKSTEVQVQEEVQALEEELQEVLRTLTPPAVDVVPELVRDTAVPVEECKDKKHSRVDGPTSKRELSPCAVVRGVVEVEVHREGTSEDNMEVEGITRKRAAASDSDDVLTPAQRSGRKEEQCRSSHDKRHRKKGGGVDGVKPCAGSGAGGPGMNEERRKGWKL